jgi:preprotein translocase subunit YajC
MLDFLRELELLIGIPFGIVNFYCLILMFFFIMLVIKGEKGGKKAEEFINKLDLCNDNALAFYIENFPNILFVYIAFIAWNEKEFPLITFVLLLISYFFRVIYRKKLKKKKITTDVAS